MSIVSNLVDLLGACMAGDRGVLCFCFGDDRATAQGLNKGQNKGVQVQRKEADHGS
jgi:hypothetical protein